MPTLSTGSIQRPGARREPTLADLRAFASAAQMQRELVRRAVPVPVNLFDDLPAGGTPEERLRAAGQRGFPTSGVRPVTNMNSAHETYLPAPPQPPPASSGERVLKAWGGPGLKAEDAEAAWDVASEHPNMKAGGLGDFTEFPDYRNLTVTQQEAFDRIARRYPVEHTTHGGPGELDRNASMAALTELATGDPFRAAQAASNPDLYFRNKEAAAASVTPTAQPVQQPATTTMPTTLPTAADPGSPVLSALGALPGLVSRGAAAAEDSLRGFVAGGRAADFERQHELQDSLADQLGYERGDNIYVDPITQQQLGANPYDAADDPGPGEMMLGPSRSNIVRGGDGAITAVPEARPSNEYVVNPTTGDPEQLGENRRYFGNDGYAIDRAPTGASQAATTDANGVTTFPGLKAAATTRAQDLRREIDFRREKMGGTGYFAPSPDEAARHQAALASAQAELDQIGRQEAESMDALSRVAAANVRAQGKAATEQTDNRSEVLGVAQALAQQIGLEGDPSVLLKPIGRGVWTINDTAFKHFTKSSGDQRVDLERARIFQSMAATIDKTLAGVASYSMTPEERLAAVSERDRLNALAMQLAQSDGAAASGESFEGDTEDDSDIPDE